MAIKDPSYHRTYKAKWRNQNVADGKCRCGGQLDADKSFKTCQNCRDRDQRKFIDRKNRGVCAVAPKPPNLSKPDYWGGWLVNGNRPTSLNRPVTGREICRTQPAKHAFFNALTRTQHPQVLMVRA